MSLKQYVEYKLYRLKTLDPETEFNGGMFNIAIVILLFGVIAAIKVDWVIIIPTFIVYSFLAYFSVKW